MFDYSLDSTTNTTKKLVNLCLLSAIHVRFIDLNAVGINNNKK